MNEETMTLWAEAIYGANTRKGLVKLNVKESEIVISPDEARAFAMSIMECAEAAETDEFLMTWLSNVVGAQDDQKNVLLLREFRQWREMKKSQ